jgi:hypothetical protein
MSSHHQVERIFDERGTDGNEIKHQGIPSIPAVPHDDHLKDLSTTSPFPSGGATVGDHSYREEMPPVRAEPGKGSRLGMGGALEEV